MREWSAVNMVMKIGVQGRIIVGPAGGPGQVDVPLRFAVVQAHAGAACDPIVTKLVRIPVTLAPATAMRSFTHIEEGLSFPLPPPTSLLDEYIVYIGFDPLVGAADKRPKPAAKPKPRPKPRRTPQPAQTDVLISGRRTAGLPAAQIGDRALERPHVGDDGAGAGGDQIAREPPGVPAAADKADRLHARRAPAAATPGGESSTTMQSAGSTFRSRGSQQKHIRRRLAAASHGSRRTAAARRTAADR